MRILINPDTETKQHLCNTAVEVIAELKRKHSLTKKELQNIYSVAEQMASIQEEQFGREELLPHAKSQS